VGPADRGDPRDRETESRDESAAGDLNDGKVSGEARGTIVFLSPRRIDRPT